MTLEVSREVILGDYLEEDDHANILMGSFIWDDESENDMYVVWGINPL